MARPPKRQVTYWASKGGYGVWVGGMAKIVKGPKDEPDGPTYLACLDL